MAEVKTVVTLKRIQEIVGQIVAHFHPRKIILFGSYAYGTATVDSDVDLLVMMDTEEKPLHVAAQIAAAIDHPFLLDIIVFTPSDWNASLKRKGIFATEVMMKGIVLYEVQDTVENSI